MHHQFPYLTSDFDTKQTGIALIALKILKIDTNDDTWKNPCQKRWKTSASRVQMIWGGVSILRVEPPTPVIVSVCIWGDMFCWCFHPTPISAHSHTSASLYAGGKCESPYVPPGPSPREANGELSDQKCLDHSDQSVTSSYKVEYQNNQFWAKFLVFLVFFGIFGISWIFWDFRDLLGFIGIFFGIFWIFCDFLGIF